MRIDEADARRAEAAARSIGIRVALSSLGLLICGAAILVIGVTAHAWREGMERGDVTSPIDDLPGADHGWVVDRDSVVAMVVVLAVMLAIAIGVLARSTVRRAVTPLTHTLSLQRHFVADASHELRAPLTVLSTRIQLIQRRMDRGEDIRDSVVKLDADVSRMAAVLTELLETAEATTTVSRRTAVETAVAEAVHVMNAVAESRSVTIVTELPADTAVVSVPEPALTRSLIALLDNAMRYSPSDSTVEILVRVLDSSRRRRMVEIAVRDHGPGIHGVCPDDVFDRFVHTRASSDSHQGSGIGLSMVRDVARSHDGDAEVLSTGARGTTIAMRMPMIQ